MAKRLQKAEAYLLSLLDQERWVLKVNLSHWIMIKLPSREDADYLVSVFKDVLVEWAASRAPVYFEFEGRVQQLQEDGQMGNIAIAGVPVNRAMLDVFGMILSNPDRSFGLVRLADERQISVNGGAGGKFLVGMDTSQASMLKRADYFHPEDLFNFNRDWQQRMTAGSDQWFEYSYRSFDPLADDPGPDKCDYIFTTRYRLILGPNDAPYHLGENIDLTPIL